MASSYTDVNGNPLKEMYDYIDQDGHIYSVGGGMPINVVGAVPNLKQAERLVFTEIGPSKQ
jgi:hypothetical protein